MKYWFGDCSDENLLVITDKKQYKEIKSVLCILISKSIRYTLIDDKDFVTYELVGFGKGLSKVTPTEIIGIDEGIINTYHLGIGDILGFGINNEASIHQDVVIHEPKVEILS